MTYAPGAGGFNVSRAEQLFGIDRRGLTVFRIGLAALLIADLLYRALDFRAHYTDLGVLPRALYLELFANVEITWSLHLILGSEPYTLLLFVLAGAAAIALLLGSHTRSAVLISWVLLVSLHNRQPLVLSGSDMILRLLLFWSLFLPLGGPPSLDRRSVSSASPRVVLSPASVGLLIQVLLVYAFSVAHKLMDPAWTELVAIEETMRVEGVATALGRELLAYPALMRAATASTLVVEVIAPLLAFWPWAVARTRIGVVAAMCGFHLLGVGGTMNLGLFEYVMVLAWVPFLPPLFWDWVSFRLSWATRALHRGRSTSRAGRSATASWAGTAAGCIAALALLLIVVDNVASLDRARFKGLPWTILRIPTRALALSQNWRLWSTPLRNRYYVFRACLEDGSEIDLHTDRALDWDEPRRSSRNNHWWKYQLSLGQPARHRLRPAYAAHLTREWNARNASSRHVASLELVQIDASHRDGPISQLPREILWRGGCPGRCGL
jgi:hypothetical protein